MIQRPKGVTLFRGYAGECAMSFFKHPPLLSILGISIVYYLVFLILSHPISKMPALGVLVPISYLILHSAFASRFALSSQKGLFKEGLSTSVVSTDDSIGYTFKLLFASLVYIVPSIIVGLLLSTIDFGKISQTMAMIQMDIDGKIPALPFGAFLLISGSCIFTLFMAYLVPISHLIALTTNAPTDTWNPTNWLYFIKKRKEDSLYFALVLFGSTLIVSLILCLILTSLAAFTFPIFKSVGFVSFLYSLYMSLHMASMSILSGRLSGACIFGANEITNDDNSANTTSSHYEPLQTGVQPTLSSPISHTPKPEPSLSLNQRIQRVENLMESNLDLAIKTFADIEVDFPLDIKLAKLKTLLHIKAGNKGPAIEAGQIAISKAIFSGSNILATDLYIQLDKWRLELPLSTSEYKVMGHALKNEKHYKDSVWCFYQYGKLSQSLEEAENLVLDVAKHVELNDDAQKALPLYRFILKYFPETTHRGYIEKVIEYNKSQ